MPAYAELQVTSNFSFLRGASHPEELVEAAARLGLGAIAIADRNTLAGVVRAHAAAKRTGVRLVVGARLDLTDGPSVLCFPTDRPAYGRLARLLTLGNRRAAKGRCRLALDDLFGESFAGGEGQIAVTLPPPDFGRAEAAGFASALHRLRHSFGRRLHLAAHRLYRGDDDGRIEALADLAGDLRVALVATNDVHMHEPSRRPLQDVLVCIREGVAIETAGFRLFANAERHLKPPDEMARLFRRHPDAVARTMEIAESCAFNLDDLRYEYPVDPVPGGATPQRELVRLARAGAAERYPEGVPAKVEAQIAHELKLIAELGFAPYFLTVHDIVRFARARGILCQGRGSAANSAVCYCLGITAVDPGRVDLLFERFVSAARGEPPDIDVDFEHERREEVIQYVYEKYGRERAGMTATVVTYRTKGALREVAKALGLAADTAVALQRAFWRRAWDEVTADRVREAGLDPAAPKLRLLVRLAGLLLGFPRHLSQHTGGMVITAGPLSEVVPIGNAAMDGRTVIEWDKGDLDALGILKVDILGLGMLTAVRKSFDLVRRHQGRALDLASVPAEDAAVYDMLCEADSVGVFQVESRAQMSMLPRLRPRSFYDLVIEVAIVRPGPIQGDMVHPYLRRRNGEEAVLFPSRELEQVLGKTLGVPLFQEQAMRIAIVAAGFTPEEADRLRRAMAAFRRAGEIHRFRDKFIGGMVGRGYERPFAERCFQQIEGFADYGFPESHAASFALLVYVSAWLKRHHPAAFACALLDSQPMGFYAPAQLVRDAREHGVEVRPVDVNASEWDCTLEEIPPSLTLPLKGGGKEKISPSPSMGEGWGGGEGCLQGRPIETRVALRLGFRLVKGLAAKDAELLLAGRGTGFSDVHALARAGVGKGALAALAAADAFGSLGLDRRRALWAVKGLDAGGLPLFAAAPAPLRREPAVTLPPMSLGEQVAGDYRAQGLSLKAHPLALLRDRLDARDFMPAGRLAALAHGRRVRVAGLVTVRQQPASAGGVVFITIEDESGIANLILWPKVLERFRAAVLSASLLGVEGRLQREGIVVHVLAEKLFDLTGLLALLEPAAAARVPPAGRSPSAGIGPDLGLAARDFH